ncbi:MAG: MBL fold metallo-hydrolase [Hymenobacter sp.]
MVGRHPTAQILAVGEGRYLIDCGEGTQLRMLEHRRRFSTLRVIFISHLHGDHYFGLFGLLSTLQFAGPAGAAAAWWARPAWNSCSRPRRLHSQMQLSYPLTFVPVDTEAHAVVYEDALVRVSSLPMRHRVPCCGYLFEEQPRRAKLLKERLPPGLTPTELCPIGPGPGPTCRPRPPAARPCAHADVSAPAAAAAPLRLLLRHTLHPQPGRASAQGVDLLYHEATFLHDLRERAATNPPQHRPPGRRASPRRRRAPPAHRPLLLPLQAAGRASARSAGRFPVDRAGDGRPGSQRVG